MFWKRKDKKKDGDEAGGSGAASAVTTKSTDAQDAATDDASAEPESARDEAPAAKGEAAATTSKAAKSAKKSKESEASETADSATAKKSAAEDRSAGKKAAADADAASGDEDGDGAADDDTAPVAEQKSAAKDKGAGKKAAADADAASGDEDGDEAADDEVATGKRPVTAADDPEIPGATEPDDEGVQRVRTVGVLNAEDQEIDVVSNTWIVDVDDEGVIVIDPAHDAKAILDAVGEREIYLVACTNGYNTHISAAIDVAERDETPIALPPRELRSWRRVHGAERRPDHEIEGGGALEVGDLEIDVLAIPGTSNGSVGLYIAERGVVFSGDTLRKGELGTVGDGYIDYTRQLHSVGEVLLSLPPDTRVLPDSGPETTVERESRNFDAWVATS